MILAETAILAGVLCEYAKYGLIDRTSTAGEEGLLSAPDVAVGGVVLLGGGE